MDRRGEQNEPYEPAPYEQNPYTYQPPPSRAAARPRWKTPLIAAGALIVGIAIGAAAGAGSKGTTATSGSTGAAAPATSRGALAPSSPAAAAAPAKSVVLQVSGTGTKTTKNFTIGKGDWSLAYTYDCSGFASGQGNFQVYEDYPNGQILANELGKSGKQTTYQHGDSGTHSLEVNSECAWSITATDGDGG
jgi:hypothetical protein